VAGCLDAQFRFQDLSLLHRAGARVTGSQVILYNLAAHGRQPILQVGSHCGFDAPTI
jgi:hypothetical protein